MAILVEGLFGGVARKDRVAYSAPALQYDRSRAGRKPPHCSGNWDYRLDI
jgi:hypothetical protein